MISFRSRLVFSAVCCGCGTVAHYSTCVPSIGNIEDFDELVQVLTKKGWAVQGLESYCRRCKSEKKHLNHGADDG